MSKKSIISLIVCVVIWVITLIFAFCAYSTTMGYSLFALVILPLSLLVYLGNYFDAEDKPVESTKKKETDDNSKDE